MSDITNASTSLALSQQLNRIGNGDGNKLLSIDISNFFQMNPSISDNEIHVCVIGGIVDGTASIPNDDIDVMGTVDCITITETSDHIVPNEDQLIVTMKRKGDRPGFILLKLLPCYTSFLKQVSSSIYAGMIFLEVHGEGFYLQSTNLIEYCTQKTITGNYRGHRSGPAITLSCRLKETIPLPQNIDIVLSIFYPKWPDEARAWPDRVRKCSWPPGEMILAIVSSGCHIVPKGSQGGEFSDIEWCISFAMHEKCLIRSLTSVQYHHYILLKLILKHKFLPKYPDILTSYVAKTVCLWQMELNKREMWQTKYLVDMIVQSMLFLRDCVSNRYVSHYFIPENNIVHGKLTFQMRNELYKDLSDFVSVFIDLCKKPKEHEQFLFGKNKLDIDIQASLIFYYSSPSLLLNTSVNPIMVENVFRSVEMVHGSVINASGIVQVQTVFNVAHKTLLKCISESELHVEDYHYRLEHISLLQQLSSNCGFSTKVRLAEIHYMLGQRYKCIAIIMEALTMLNSLTLKGFEDIKNRDKAELLLIIKARPLMSLSQFLGTYIIEPIQFSEEHIHMWSIILQQDIFQILRKYPINVDALVYAWFLLVLAFQDLARIEMVEEAMNTLICLTADEPSKLDYKDVAMCLLDYVVNLTFRTRTAV